MFDEKQLKVILEKFKDVCKTGKTADYIPELAAVDSNYLGAAIVNPDGIITKAGNHDIYFAIESISKNFRFYEKNKRG